MYDSNTQGRNSNRNQPLPTSALNTNQSVTNPNGGTGGQPLQLASAAPAANPRNPANKPALPPMPTSFVPNINSPTGPNTIRNPNTNKGPGAHGFIPTTAPHGFDLSTPGQKEQFWTNNQNLWFDMPGVDWVQANQGQFTDPWQGETTNTNLLGTIAQPGAGQQYWGGVQGSMNTPTGAEQAISGGYQGPNNAQTAFDTMGGRLPQSFQPQWDAYYDRMKQKTMGDVNAQSAARGTYGSNAALNGSIGAALDAEALRAKDSAQFMLDDSANQRAWMDSYSSAGRAADLSGENQFKSSLDAAKYGLDKTKAYGDLAFKSEQMDFDKNRALSDIAFGIDDHKKDRLSTGADLGLAADQVFGGRLNDAFEASGGAQDAFENRTNDLYGKNEDFSNDLISFATDNYDKLFGADGQADEAEIEALVAQYADARGWDDQQREIFARDLGTLIEGYAATKK